MSRLNTFIKITTHLGFWLLLVLVNNLLIRKDGIIEFDPLHQFITILIYALVFYLNYYFLMPFLFRKRLFLFIAFSLILLSGSIFLNNTFQNNHFEKTMLQKMENEFKKERSSRRFPPPLPPPNHSYKPPGRMNRLVMKNASGLFLFYVLSFAASFVKKWQDDEQSKSELEKEKIKTELTFLRQQINPHFLFNSLNSIYSLSISKSDITTSSILKLSSILRYMLYEPEDSLVSLEDEIRVIRDYIDLQRLRITDKVSISLQVEGNPYAYKIEQFILIPIIENAFKFSIDNVNDSFIDINISILEDKFSLIISNKIVPLPEGSKKDSGIGLKNVKRRLELLYPGTGTNFDKFKKFYFGTEFFNHI